jgi:protein-S-isoprenylcysteine O-methyltransferase Ste14
MNKLNFMGIGPKIAVITFPWLAAAVFLTLKFNDSFIYSAKMDKFLFYSGLVLVAAGSVMYFLTVPSLLKGLKETKLMTGGTFYLCCNPLYSSIILLIIPGVSLMMNSWLILTTSVAAYSLFRIYIKSEYEEMEKFFGDDFRRYKAETPEFFPLPLNKWF